MTVSKKAPGTAGALDSGLSLTVAIREDPPASDGDNHNVEHDGYTQMEGPNQVAQDGYTQRDVMSNLDAITPTAEYHSESEGNASAEDPAQELFPCNTGFCHPRAMGTKVIWNCKECDPNQVTEEAAGVKTTRCAKCPARREEEDMFKLRYANKVSGLFTREVYICEGCASVCKVELQLKALDQQREIAIRDTGESKETTPVVRASGVVTTKAGFAAEADKKQPRIDEAFAAAQKGTGKEDFGDKEQKEEPVDDRCKICQQLLEDYMDVMHHKDGEMYHRDCLIKQEDVESEAPGKEVQTSALKPPKVLGLNVKEIFRGSMILGCAVCGEDLVEHTSVVHTSVGTLHAACFDRNQEAERREAGGGHGATLTADNDVSDSLPLTREGLLPEGSGAGVPGALVLTEDTVPLPLPSKKSRTIHRGYSNSINAGTVPEVAVKEDHVNHAKENQQEELISETGGEQGRTIPVLKALVPLQAGVGDDYLDNTLPGDWVIHKILRRGLSVQDDKAGVAHILNEAPVSRKEEEKSRCGTARQGGTGSTGVSPPGKRRNQNGAVQDWLRPATEQTEEQMDREIREKAILGINSGQARNLAQNFARAGPGQQSSWNSGARGSGGDRSTPGSFDNGQNNHHHRHRRGRNGFRANRGGQPPAGGNGRPDHQSGFNGTVVCCFFSRRAECRYERACRFAHIFAPGAHEGCQCNRQVGPRRFCRHHGPPGVWP